MNPALVAEPAPPPSVPPCSIKAQISPDYDAFARDLDRIKETAKAEFSQQDIDHLRRVEWRGRFCTLLGYLTAAFFPNPISAVLMAYGLLSRWLMAHHICHGGYDRIPGIPARYTSKVFAKGWRRYIDWFDWIQPQAWRYEHDFLHHYYTSEAADPDVLERNAHLLRRLPLPMFLKYVVLLVAAMTWKFTYYAANTLNGLASKEQTKVDTHHNYINLTNFWDLRLPLVRQLWFGSWFPYGCFHFVLVPLLFLPFGKHVAIGVLLTRILAELLHNLHMFLIIVPNHAGDDILYFNEHYRSRKGFYVNQVLSSVNYRCGTEWLDYNQMWLNYQIEHHLFPAMPMLAYRRMQPQVKQLCQDHGITYIQGSLWQRVGKMMDIAVGKTSMPRADLPAL